jgi:hypothetical protein
MKPVMPVRTTVFDMGLRSGSMLVMLTWGLVTNRQARAAETKRGRAMAAPFCRRLQQSPRDDLRLDLGGTLEDVEDPRIAQDAADPVFQREAVAAVDLQRVVGAAQATRAPSSLAIPASRSQRRSWSFSHARNRSAAARS